MNTRQKTIMVIDDRPANLDLLKDILGSRNYRVLVFPRGPIALLASLAAPPDLILLDILMPEMDGFEVCRRLKEEEITRGIPVIFLSALDDIENKMKGFACGGIDYLTKPFQEEEVLVRVETQLKILDLQRELRLHNEKLEDLVAQRTRELTLAHERLQQMDQLKDDFLTMISHELRTPANGLIGIGDIMGDLLPPGPDTDELVELFGTSADRMQSLIQNATIIMDLNQSEQDSEQDSEHEISFDIFLEELRYANPKIQISSHILNQSRGITYAGRGDLMKRVSSAIGDLLGVFSGSKSPLPLGLQIRGQKLILEFPLDNLTLEKDKVDQFFEIDTLVRCTSVAQSLGITPVVAKRILNAYGGDIAIFYLDDSPWENNHGGRGKLHIILKQTNTE